MCLVQLILTLLGTETSEKGASAMKVSMDLREDPAMVTSHVSIVTSNHCFQISGGFKAGSHLTFAFPEDVKFILTLCECKH